MITPDDPNTKVILETLTGRYNDQYCLLQRYVPNIEQGEKRVLRTWTSGGSVPATAGSDHRTNIVQGAHYESCDLTTDERLLCERVGTYLLRQGAEYVGMDLAYPWVIEFNVVNPGGLLTIEELTGVDLTSDIVRPILDTF